MKRMPLSRALRRMYDQRLAEAYRPVWSPGIFELNLISLWPPALETAIVGLLPHPSLQIVNRPMV